MTNRKPDYWLLTSTILLILIGAMMVYSASAIFALEKYHDPFYFFKKEILFCTLGFLLLFITQRVDYHRYWKLVYPLMFITAFFCILVAIPGIGVKVGGARRWISVLGFTFQPSEMVKIALILFMAYSLTKKREKMENFSIGVLPHIIVAGGMMALIVLQKDLGTVVTLAFVMMVLLYVGGTKVSYLAGAILLFLIAFVILIMVEPYRMMRFLAYLDPWKHLADTGFQVIQSFMGFNQGGIWGAGLGQGRQKLFYLPAAHTDFILSVVGEELGLFGVLTILALFAILIIRGFRASICAPDLFGTYLALGITALFVVQSFINFGVVMGLLPTKGLPLPFISYGGTSILVMSVCVGVLLNVSSQAGTGLSGKG
ncbi:MAG: putative lipid II flippase FtsW [Deltaproteobacteria bacterium]|nr:putative lipid II flippase FtsW [Deltaproteobacteria bacterium]